MDTTVSEDDKYDYEYNGITWMPPTDVAIVVEIQGLWYSKKLALDADNNYWSVNHPEALIAAAAYILEVMYRNTEGMKDWLGAITMLTSGIEMDMIEEESYNTNIIKG